MSPLKPESTEPSPTPPEPQGGDARRFIRRGLFGASAGAAAAIVSRGALAQEGDNLPNLDGFVSAYPSPGATAKP
jgi:hypothetical protein